MTTKTDIIVDFLDITNDDKVIMSESVSGYPSYNDGSIIFLERKISINAYDRIKESISEIELTKYKVINIIHSLKQHWGPEDKTYSFFRLEVYVEEVK